MPRRSDSHNFGQLFPDLAGEWDWERNTTVPEDHAPRTRTRVHWACPVAPDHRWLAAIVNRVNGRGCPFCSGRRPSSTHNLALGYPAVAEQWDHEKNDGGPTDVTHGSETKVWWRCDQGPDHHWQQSPNARTANWKPGRSGCPFCRGLHPSVTNRLDIIFPEIAAQWHPTKNGGLLPEQVVSKSSRKVWWRCSAGPDHEWQTTVALRTSQGTGCPYCAGQAVSVTNSLAALYPDIAAEWVEAVGRYGGKTPAQVTASSGVKVRWRCRVDGAHTWLAQVHSRTASGQGCPACSGRIATSVNNLLVKNSVVAGQWVRAVEVRHQWRTPSDVPVSSNIKVVWRCPVDPDHTWVASVNARTKRNPTGCPHCAALSRRSWQEVALLHELRLFFEIEPDDQCLELPGYFRDADIILRHEHIVVEFDGHHWHKDKEDTDLAKLKALADRGWTVVRAREEPLEPLGEHDVVVPLKNSKATANAVLRKLDYLAGPLDGLADYLREPLPQAEQAARRHFEDLLREGRAAGQQQELFG